MNTPKQIELPCFLTPEWLLDKTNGVSYTDTELYGFIVKFNNRQLNDMTAGMDISGRARLYSSAFKDDKLKIIHDYLFYSNDNKLYMEYIYMSEIGLCI